MKKKENEINNLFVFFYFILLWKTIEAIRFEYKFSNNESLTYSEIQFIERYDMEKHLDETIEYIEMNYTEKIIEIESIKNIQRRVYSIRMFPFNKYKYEQLFEITYRKTHNLSITHPAELSSWNGRILLSPPNEPNFPQDDILIGTTWKIPIINSFGEIQYTLNNVDDNQIAFIEFKSDLVSFIDTNLNGKWMFDMQKGITISLESICSSSILSNHIITKIIKKQFLSIS